MVGSVQHVGEVGIVAAARHEVFRVRLIAYLVVRDQKRGLVLQDAYGKTKPGKDRAWTHVLRVALGQVIVHRNQVYAEAGKRIQVQGQRRYQRLAFTGLHLGDLAAMQNDAAHDLDVKMTAARIAL